jgi:hypothetical protein
MRASLCFLLCRRAWRAFSKARGEWGFVVALCVFFAAWAFQRALYAESLREVGVHIGGFPGLIASVAISAAFEDATFPLVWMGLALVLSWSVFLIPRRACAELPGQFRSMGPVRPH